MGNKLDFRNDWSIKDNEAFEQFRIDPLTEIQEPPVYCKIGNTPTMTGGNFSLMNGKAKSGKTFFLGSIVASMLNDSIQLGNIQGTLPVGKKNIIYFDTEQSGYHANRTIKRICDIIDNTNPPNLFAYGIRPLNPAARLAFIESKISTVPNVGLVIIDGVRDLLSIGINDETEATSLTSKFLKWTYELDIHLVLLLHQNKTDLNARGHIGTELLNKAETTMSITKDPKSSLFTVSCELSRDIPFNDFGFTIDGGKLYLTDLPTKTTSKPKDPKFIANAEHYNFIRDAFKEHSLTNCNDFKDAICYNFTVSDKPARTFVSHYLSQGWIKKVNEGNKRFYEVTI